MSGDDEHWDLRAACRGQPLYLFYGPSNDSEQFRLVESPHNQRVREREALSYCEHCPVLAQCRAEQLSLPLSAQHGVSGGITEKQRRRLSRARGW